VNFGNELVATFKDLRAYSVYLTKREADAQDLMQDTLLKAWQSQHMYKPGTSLRAWTCSIMHNLYISQVRYYAVRRKHEHKLVPVLDTQPASQEHRVELRQTIEAMTALH